MRCYSGWRRCRYCQAAYGDYTAWGKTTGICPASKKRDYHPDLEGFEYPHAPEGPEYVMGLGDGNPNGALLSAGIGSWWRMCGKCQALFFARDPGASACPMGGSHEPMAQHYCLRFGELRLGAEAGWRYCQKCQGLFSIQSGLGVCPRDLGPHDPLHSREFFMRLAGLQAPDRVHVRWENTPVYNLPVLGHVYLTVDLMFQSSGTCTYKFTAKETGLTSFNARASVRILDFWDEEDKDFLSSPPLPVSGLLAPGPSVFDAPKADFTSLWVKDHWADIAPGCKVMLVPSVTPDAVNTALIVGGLAALVPLVALL